MGHEARGLRLGSGGLLEFGNGGWRAGEAPAGVPAESVGEELELAAA